MIFQAVLRYFFFLNPGIKMDKIGMFFSCKFQNFFLVDIDMAMGQMWKTGQHRILRSQLPVIHVSRDICAIFS